MSNIDLSVIILTYNHEKYVKQALDSVLEQETDFNFEIIIGDDCSSDETVKIINEYYDKFPRLIKLIVQNKNVGTTKNYKECVHQSSGKYVTCFGGDDYWINKKKIDTQLKWLSLNPNYVGVGHGILIRSSNVDVIGHSPIRSMMGKDVILNDFTHDRNYPLPSVIYRNLKFDKMYNKYMNIITQNRLVDDLPISLILLMMGKVRILDEFYSVYRQVNRQNEGEAHNYNSIRTINQKLVDHYSIYKNLENEFGIKLTYLYSKKLLGFFFYGLKYNEINDFISFFNKCEIRIKISFLVNLPMETTTTLYHYIKRRFF